MHCNVDGKAFAAATDLQKTDISRVLKVQLPGLILEFASMLSATEVPAKVLYWQLNEENLRFTILTCSIKFVIYW